MLVTHLQGPHQSVCWLRPKRARHFLGEPGSEHRHAQHEWEGVGAARRGEKRREEGQNRQTEERESQQRRNGHGGRARSWTGSRSDLLVEARSKNTLGGGV